MSAFVTQSTRWLPAFVSSKAGCHRYADDITTKACARYYYAAELTSRKNSSQRNLSTRLSYSLNSADFLSRCPFPTRVRLCSSIRDSEDDKSNSNSSDDVEKVENRQLSLHPKAPLHTSLTTSPKSDHHYFSHYTLPPIRIGIDDIRPILPQNQRIVAFGDVHGDISALRKFLLAAQVLHPDSTEEHPIWSGGSTICVQTGDLLDRGNNELECFRVLSSLAQQASQWGGAVYILYGNHESLNSAGLFSYAFPEGNWEFEQTIGKRLDDNFGTNRWRLQFGGNEPARWATLEPGGLLAGKLGKEEEVVGMLGNLMVSCVLGRTVFVHGGLRADHLRVNDSSRAKEKNNQADYYGISRLNWEAREWIMRAHHGENNNWGQYNTVEEVLDAAQHRADVASKAMPDCLGGGIGSSSPVWMRDYSQPNDKEPKNPKAKEMIVAALKATGPNIQRMVMGHTPQYRINSALGGRAWRIDVGASQGVMGGTPEVLEIVHMGGENGEDLVSVLTVDGKRIDGKERAVVESIIP